MISFLRNYEFLNFTKSVTEAQMALYKTPNQTWSQIGNKFYNVCWYNCKAIGMVGIDVLTYLAVSTLRNCGLCCPLPPPPPTFPIPHDNVEFIRYSIQRALWDWEPNDRKELEEGIEECLSDKWNVYQVVGEWSIAFSLENAHKASFYKPSFITVSEALEHGETCRTVANEFARLRQKEKTIILNALYHQEAPPSLSSSAKKVYQDIRALASKFQQGNQNYLNAFSEYVKQKSTDSISASTSTIPLQSRVALPSSVEPSAPLEPALYSRELQLANNIATARLTLRDAVQTLSPSRKKLIIQSILRNQSLPFISWSDPQFLTTTEPDAYPKFFIAKLAFLRFFRDHYQRSEIPSFISSYQRVNNGRTIGEIDQSFASSMEPHDFIQLQNAIVNPNSVQLNSTNQRRLAELCACAELIQQNDDFTKVYDGLRLDLEAFPL